MSEAASCNRGYAQDVVSRVVKKITDITGGSPSRPVPLHAPVFRGNEKSYVVECIETGWVSSVGNYVDRFEKDLADFVGAKRAVAVVNGTAALHLCLVVAGVRRDDEVLIPDVTFVATANAVSYIGAVPHFCDVSSQNLGLCPEKLESYLQEIVEINSDGACVNKKTGRVLRAIVPMHCYGLPVNMDALCHLAEKYNIVVVEDAAESLGSSYKGRHTGLMGKMGAISFNGNKIMTTGGGGAIVTNDEALADRLKHLSTTAKASCEGFFYHDAVGYNYRMPNINAALGCAQLEELPAFLEAKRRLSRVYQQALSECEGVHFLTESPDARANYWLCGIRFDDAEQCRAVLEALNANGIMARPLWSLMHSLPMYQDCPRMDVSCAESLVARVLALPSSVTLNS